MLEMGNVSLAFIGNEIYIDETDITNFCERCMKSHVNSDGRCVICDNRFF